jgi:ferredoxin
LKREWNQLEEAAVDIQKGLELAEAGDDIFFLKDTYLARIRLAQSEKDWEIAFRYLQQAEQAAARCPTSIDVAYLQSWRARLQLAQGNLSEASVWAEKKPPEDEKYFGPQPEFELLTLARRTRRICAPVSGRGRADGKAPL